MCLIPWNMRLRLEHRTFDAYQLSEQLHVPVTQLHGNAHHLFRFIRICPLQFQDDVRKNQSYALHPLFGTRILCFSSCVQEQLR